MPLTGQYRLNRVWTSTLVLLLGGCNLAPEYKQPESPVPAQFPEQLQLSYNVTTGLMSEQVLRAQDLTAQGGDAAEMAWQDFFRDPPLKTLISMALQSNRDLQLAVARMDEAQALWGIQRGEMFPTLGAGITGARQLGPVPGAGSNIITSQYSAGIAVTAFELDLFGRLRNLSEAAFQQYLATAEGARAVQITLVADTAIQYFRWRMASLLLELTRQTLESRQRSYRLVNARFGNGIASEIDVVQAKTLVDSAAADLARYTRDEQLARNALAVLLGRPVPPDLPAGMPFDDIQLLANIPAGLPADLIINRPDIRAAENLLLAANANIGAARAAFLPNISLTGNLGTASSSLGGLFKSGSGAWAFTPSITTPIFTGGSLQAGLEQAKASERAALATYDQRVQQAFREVADALAGEASLQAQFAARRAQLSAAEQFLRLSNARFFNGVNSFLDVQIAEIQVFSSRQQMVMAAFETVSNRVNLYKALGGGLDPGAVKSRISEPITVFDQKS